MDPFHHWKSRVRQQCPALHWIEYAPMHQYTTFRIGGPVRILACPTTQAEAALCVTEAQTTQVPFFILGNGSNLLAEDGMMNLLLIHTGALQEVTPGPAHTLQAGSGILLSRLAKVAAEQGLAGLEFAHGIPGTLGGAIRMNGGAYGGEMAQVIQETFYLSTQGQLHSVQGPEHQFSYRHSVFQQGEMILSSLLQLQPDDPRAITQRMGELTQKRREKQPLDYPSAGSMFKRPKGGFASALIEQCGCKGLRVGGAQVSEKHAGFVINLGDATCRDVLALVELVQERVLSQTGIALEMEVQRLTSPES